MWSVNMPSTVRQPLARPESAVGRCWSAARRPEASRIHKIDALYGGSPISGADSLVICSQNQFWYPKLLPPARSARMGAEKRISHPWRPKTASYHTALPGVKNLETPKNAIKSFGSQWILEASGRRVAPNTAPRPIRAAPTVGAPSGACGWTTYRYSCTQLYRPHLRTWDPIAIGFGRGRRLYP